jgi:dipeptidyl aminopeptidase/acylaminoacyl peptidase
MASLGRRDYYLWCRQNGLWPEKISGHDPAKEPDWFTPYIPERNVESQGRKYPPTLLLHGDADTDVPYEQSVIMARRLAAAGIEHELITISDGSHGFDHSPDSDSNTAV